MAERMSNVDLAQGVRVESHDRERSHWTRRASITEAFLLSVVALATAWSGYQAARWDAESTRQYAKETGTTVRSQVKATLAGQDRLYDIVTFNGWAAARTAGNNKLAAYYERRFRPEYATAFTAWEKLDPFNNLSAPPEPIFMREYANAHAQESTKL